MAILKNKIHNSYKIPTALEFGKSDITVTCAHAPDYSCVLFKTEKCDFVGQEIENEKGLKISDYKPDVVMFFDDIKSIDVVIHFLNESKERLLNIHRD